MDLRFDGKVAIVTGSARGIGFKVAELMVESGAKVAMVDILADRLQESAKTLQSKGVAKPYVLDLTKVPDIKATVSKIRQEMGEIDVLIQAAAIGPSAAAEDITEEAWDKCFAVNTKGLFFMMQQVVVQSMAPRKKGSIVNFSSIAGMKGMRSPHRALAEVRRSLMRRMTTVIDVDLAKYFDNVRHDVLLGKIARRVQDPKILHLVKLIIKVGGKKGVPQGGPFSPLAANIYLNEVDWYFDD